MYISVLGWYQGDFVNSVELNRDNVVLGALWLLVWPLLVP